MSLPPALLGLSFRRQKLGFLLSLILFIMVYLGGLAMAAQAVLVRASLAWGNDLEGRVTIEIPANTGATSVEKDADAQKVLEQIKGMPTVEQARIVPDEETVRLLKPWIQDADLLASLPLPKLLDVQMKTGMRADADAFRQRIVTQIKDVQIHTHAGWMDSLLGFVHGLGALAGVMLFLTGLALVAVVSIVCRAAMAFQQDVIELLHVFGATDQMIAGQFQRNIQTLALRSALAGFLLAALTVGLLALMLGVLGGISLVEPVSWMTVGGVMAVVPVFAWLLAIVTARTTVIKILRCMA